MEIYKLINIKNLNDLKIKDLGNIRLSIRFSKTEWNGNIYKSYRTKIIINNEVFKFDFKERKSLIEILEVIKKDIVTTVF